MAQRVSAGLSKAEGRKFGLTLGIAFLVFGGLFWWRHHETVAMVAGGIGGVMLAAGIAIPTKLGPVERAWMGMAHAISKVTTPIVMGIVYYVVVAPIGLVMRLLGRNPVVHAPRGGSYWVDRGNTASGDMRRQF